MARRIRNGNNSGPVAVPKLAAKKTGPGGNSSAASGKPHAVRRIIEFPKRPAVEDIVSKRIIFEVGNTRFAINWTAEIEQLPPAGPVAIERKRPNSNRSSQVRR
jgi:hypothetical protein